MEKNMQPKLRFKEFSGNWEQYKFKSITIKIGSGNTPKGGEKVYQNQGIPFIRSQNVNKNKLILDNVTFISDEINLKMKGSIVKENDILLNITGASIGRSCVVPKDFIIGNVNQHVCIIRLKNDNSKFIQSFLSSYRGKKLIFQGQTGSGREGLNLQSISGFKIRLPLLQEQKKIASFLSSIEEQIEGMERKKELMEDYKKGIIEEIFSQEKRFQNETGEVYPEWEKKKLGDIITLMQSGLSRKFSDTDIGVPVIRSNNLKNGRVDIDDMKYWYEVDDKGANMKNYYLKKRDLLVNFINSLAQIGKVSIYNNELSRSTIFTTNIMRLNFKDGICPEYIFNLFQTKQYNYFIQSITKPAVNQASFTTVDFKTFKISLPCLEEQEKIADYLSSIDEQIESLGKKINGVKEFKTGLLQRMFI